MYSELTVQAFQPLFNSSHTAFQSSALGATSFGYALQSTGVREWLTPTNRTVVLAGNPTNAPFYANFGSSTVSVGASNGHLVVNGGPRCFSITGTTRQSYVALVSSTTVTVSIELGHGKL